MTDRLVRNAMQRLLSIFILWWTAGCAAFGADYSRFARDRVIAWCIVPFDAVRRAPEERSAMLQRLGIRALAYDYRAEHVPHFEAEIVALQRRGLRLAAWWCGSGLDAATQNALTLFERYGVHPQLWVSISGGEPQTDPAAGAAVIKRIADGLLPLVRAAAKSGCPVALYNHGGWLGEPEQLVALCEHLTHATGSQVGIVYNLHHAHHRMDRFEADFRLMQSRLLVLNLNGMIPDGPAAGRKIEVIGRGPKDRELVRFVAESGWTGEIGILNHTDADAAVRLRENMEGLEAMVRALNSGLETEPDRIEPAAAVETLTAANGWPDAKTTATWERSNGGPTSARYSVLRQINRENVSTLREAWRYASGDGTGNVQCNAICADGTLFFPTGGGRVVAVDGATGKEKWGYLPDPRAGRPMRLEDIPARRGLLYWRDPDGGGDRLIFGGGNSIHALNPLTGEPIRGFGVDGKTTIPTGATAVGAVFGNIYVVPGFHGDVFGYDVRTGAQVWRFRTRPDASDPAFKTWSTVTEGANCWGGMSLDASRGIAYVSTGSPKPNFFGMRHLGDNLYANCVIALDAATGRKLWHFQEVRHDVWDWDLPAPPNLVTVRRNGQMIDAVAQVTKLGNTLLLDRLTGRPLFDVLLRKFPTRLLPGDVAAPWQPLFRLPEAFARQAFTQADFSRRDPAVTDAARQIVARAHTGLFPNLEEGRPTVMFNIHGGAEWTGAAYDPANGHLFVTANEIPWHITCYRDDDPLPAIPPTAGEIAYNLHCAGCHGAERTGANHVPPLRGIRYRMKRDQIVQVIAAGRGSMPARPDLPLETREALAAFLLCEDRSPTPTEPDQASQPRWTFSGWNKLLDAEGYPACTPPWGTLSCLDLNSGLIRWQRPLGEYPELTARGTPQTGTENFGGASVTAGGLVFCSGTRDKKIRAFDSTTGAELWHAALPFHGSGAPTIYEAGGQQFILIAATGGGKLGGPTGDTWIAFGLPTTAP